MSNAHSKQSIYFVGIGGIGISALARYMKAQGYHVSGSDMKQTRITDDLVKEGIFVKIPQVSDNITNPDMIVHSAIIKPSHPELVRAREKGISVYSRKEALKFILGDKKVYSVAGAHGKSTTSAMLASLMQSTMLIGAESKQYKTNMHYIDDKSIVFEADESDSSFLNCNPYVAIVTNAEPEHMEHYGHDEEKFYDAYKQYLNNATLRVLNAEDPFLATLDEIEALRLYPSRDIKDVKTILIEEEPYTAFTLKEYGEFYVWGIGEHIALDASLAILCALEELPLKEIKYRLRDYHGIKKRFDILKKEDNFVLIDDYGHHPTEIKATINSALQYADKLGIKEVTAIWQPHKYSRTLDNLEAFVECFEGVSALFILPVWSAGERYVEIDFATLFQQYNPRFIDAVAHQEFNHGLVIGFGAGDITYQLRESIN